MPAIILNNIADMKFVFIPAMNDNMYANLAVKENIKIMKGRGVEFVEPEQGELACGSIGQGRLAEPSTLIDVVKKKFNYLNDFCSLRLLVTAGPTHEFLDPVRFITNPSSGKMGYAVACAARDRGAIVTLISGPTSLEVPDGVHFISCKTSSEMNNHVLQMFSDCDILVMTAEDKAKVQLWQPKYVVIHDGIHEPLSVSRGP